LCGVVVHHAFTCYPGSDRSVGEELPAHDTFISAWRLIKLASGVNMMRDGLPLLRLSFVPGVYWEFSLLPISAFCIGKFLSGAENLFVVTGRGFCSVGGGL
jgi:hypothetical protein